MCHREDWCFLHISLSHSLSLSLSLTSCHLLDFTTFPPRCGPECAKPSGRSAVNTRSAPPKSRDEIWQQMSQRSKTAVVFTTSQTHSVILNYDNAKQCHPNHRGRVSISLSLLPSNAWRLPPMKSFLSSDFLTKTSVVRLKIPGERGTRIDRKKGERMA